MNVNIIIVNFRDSLNNNIIIPSSKDLSIRDRKALLVANKVKTLEKLDKMVEEVNEDTATLPICPFNLPPLPGSISDSGICNLG